LAIKEKGRIKPAGVKYLSCVSLISKTTLTPVFFRRKGQPQNIPVSRGTIFGPRFSLGLAGGIAA
jgi:hypothetical protein